ncbi:MAG: hypothetical protein EOO70_04125 [Myxococcaceae bacterium]|nr:MAG: hypothetical protein EOO70_04125 [Myxococcaceae bacterium]
MRLRDEMGSMLAPWDVSLRSCAAPVPRPVPLQLGPGPVPFWRRTSRLHASCSTIASERLAPAEVAVRLPEEALAAQEKKKR